MIEFLTQILRLLGWAYVHAAIGFAIVFVGYFLIMPWLPDKEDW